MASSQVELASSSPFGCVLKDHNQRNRCREGNARAATFQKNLKDLVRDHLHTCISISSSLDENSPCGQTDNPNNPSPWVGDQRRLKNIHPCLQFMSNTNSNTNTREESSGISPRQSRILDRWAARQAREMVSTIERQTHEAELLALSNSQTISLSRSNSEAQSETSAVLPNVGASSLVQMWEARLNRSSNLNINPTVDGRRANSGLSNTENASSASRASEVCDSADERFEEAPRGHENSFGDWESDDRMAPPSDPPSSWHGRDEEDAGESERNRIADIIRRLTLANGTQNSCSDDSEPHDEQQPSLNGSPSGEREHASVSDHAEQRRIRERSSVFDQVEPQPAFLHSISMPRIGERSSAFDPVEQRRFSQLGSSPRLRGRQAFNDLLAQMERDRQRELETLVERRAVSRFPQRGRIQSMLRLRFLQRALAVEDRQRSHSTASELNHRPQGSTITLLRERFNTGVEHGGMVTAPSIEADLRSPHTEIVNNSQELENSSTLNLLSEDNHHLEVDTNMLQSTPTAQHLELYASEDLHEDASLTSDVTWQETSFEASNLDTQDTADNGWDGNVTEEEQEVNNQQLIGTNYDWFSDISRPRRYWESRRQSWYEEMLDTNSQNEEIRQLLERRRVSTCLSSDFRQRMDQLMMSRMHQQMHPGGNQEEEEQDDGGSQERMDQLMSFLQRHRHQVGILKFLVSEIMSLHSQEMELICDLRGHMEQLHYEMSELRKSIKSCMNMQMKMQHSIKQEVYSVREEGKKSLNGEPRRGICCICYEMPVDSLLYSISCTHHVQISSMVSFRCGHMCTCLRCAHELQWSSGKCPICRAPIVDVVRAYADS
ncbi:hypothetical protein L1049_010545 [Liquidambar formosana]|uniref:RING-type domain-containing protein n=1 Tax=Liquidambar formosana TaxID=63359 RepID=A0AAP0N7W4_LIQFO